MECKGERSSARSAWSSCIEHRSAIREDHTWLKGQQKEWVIPPDPAAAERLAGAYRNPALGDIKVERDGADVIFVFDGWKSRVATKKNPDGTTSFVTVTPGVRGFEFNAPAPQGKHGLLVLRDPQHTYPFDAVD